MRLPLTAKHQIIARHAPHYAGSQQFGLVVITMHADMSKALENFGIKVNIIQYGERKSDYSPFKPLSEDARTRLQTDVNEAKRACLLRCRQESRRPAQPGGAEVQLEAGIFLRSGQSVGYAAKLADAVAIAQSKAFARARAPRILKRRRNYETQSYDFVFHDSAVADGDAEPAAYGSNNVEFEA